MSLDDLVRATNGRLSRDSLKKIEAGSNPVAVAVRRVDVDDLMTLSIALGVNPNALLLPPALKPSDAVEVTGAHRQLHADEAWEWARGEQPLPTPGQQRRPGTFREATNPGWMLYKEP
jgi:hypothetical protein